MLLKKRGDMKLDKEYYFGEGQKRMRVFCLFVFLFASFASRSLFATSIDGTSNVQWISGHQTFSNGDIVRGFVALKGGFTVPAASSIIVDASGPMYGPIDLSDTGELELGGDFVLGSSAHLAQGGKIKGNGFSLVLTNSLVLNNSENLRITGDIIIDGRGNDLCLSGGRIIIENNVTVTLRNVNICSLADNSGTPDIDLEGTNSKLILQNAILNLDGDYTFQDDGSLFIEGEVFVRGPHNFIYKSTKPLTIAQCALLCFEKNAIFNYQPSGASARNLLRMHDESSYLCFDEATLVACADGTYNGLQLTQGTLIFDNKVFVKNVDMATGNTENTNVSKSFELGDGTAGGDMTVIVLSGARVEVDGYMYYNPSS